MSPDVLSYFTTEFPGSVAVLSCGAPNYPHPIRDYIGNHTGCMRSMASLFGDVFRRFFQYCL